MLGSGLAGHLHGRGHEGMVLLGVCYEITNIYKSEATCSGM